MPSFQYEALKMSDRTKVTGLINSATEREARELLREQDLLPTKLKVISSDSLEKTGKKNLFKSIFYLFGLLGGIDLKDKISFSRNLGMMIRSGIPVTDALLYLENYSRNPKFEQVIGQIRRDILAGYSFSQALNKHDKVFDQVYVTVIQAGETSGELQKAIERLTDLQIKSQKLRMKIVSASVYPIIVVLITILVMLIMLIFILPTFQDLYKNLGVKLPLITQIFLGFSWFLRSWWFISFPIIGISIYGVFNYLRSAAGKSLLDTISLKIPIVSELVQMVNNSHFISTFSVSFSAGLPITDAIYLSTQTVQNTFMKSAYKDVNVQIQAGQRLGTALSKTGYLPDVILLMIATGEESGELDKMLENSFDYLEEEINHKVGILTSMMEPVMLLVLGVIVGSMAMAIYMPMFGIYDHLH